MNVLPFLSMARTQIWKPLSFDNPYDDNSLYHNGTMTWKYSGSLDDHQPRVLPLELLDERGESSIVFKPWYTEHLCYSHLLLPLLMKLGDTAFSEKFSGVTPKNLAPSLLLYPTSPSPMTLWATQYPFNITYFLANQSASKACLWHSKQTEDIKRDKSTMSLSCPVHKEKFITPIMASAFWISLHKTFQTPLNLPSLLSPSSLSDPFSSSFIPKTSME